MNLKNDLMTLFNKLKEHKDDYQKYFWFLLILIMILMVIIIFALNHSFSKSDVDDGGNKQEVVASTDQGSTDKSDNLVREYNALINRYNQEVEKYFSFKEKVESFGVSGLPNEITKKDTVRGDISRKDVDELKNTYDIMVGMYPSLYTWAENSIIGEFNEIVREFNDLMGKTSVDFLENFPARLFEKTLLKEELVCTEEVFFQDIERLSDDTKKILGLYLVLSQITNPSEEWVLNRLDDVDCVIYRKPVTAGHDPNELLNKEGGYSCCVYFNVKNIDMSSVPGNDLVDKGTSAGGAIEVYPDLESAKNRCDYLSQFDGTLIYSGSYTLLGTTVIRTSYKLSMQEQIDITSAIVEAFTAIK